MARDTWNDRDLPVLNAIVEMTEEGADGIEPAEIAQRLNMPEEDVQRALQALADESPPLFQYTDASSMAGRLIAAVANPTGQARRAVGAWPTPEMLADRLTQALAKAADNEPDAETRGWLKKTAAWLGSAGRDIAVDVAGTAIAKSTGAS